MTSPPSITEDDDHPFKPQHSSKSIKRTAPNLLITGTPGVGKSTLCTKLAEELGLNWLELSKIALKHNFIEKPSTPDSLKSPILKENALLRFIESDIYVGGNVLEYHSPSLIPKSWIDIVIVLRCKMNVLHERLEERGYPAEKIADNVAAELSDVSVDEATECFRNVHIFNSNNSKQLDKAFRIACRELEKFYEKLENKKRRKT